MGRRVFAEREARFLTNMAIREGLIRTDEPCCVCGLPQGPTPKAGVASVVRHHPDLLHRPLWTVPLCLADHQLVHAGAIPDPGRVAARRQPAPKPAPRPALVSVYVAPEDRAGIILAHFPVGEKRTARQLANELGWARPSVHAILRELRLQGVVDCPFPSEGFIRLDVAA
jgi:hypothetical protein